MRRSERLVFLLIFCLLPALAPAESHHERGKTKKMDFEGDVVEGVGRQALDSLNQLAEEQDAQEKMHIYNKRTGFQLENKETLREITESK